MNKNQRIIKFVRKEMQSSEEINPKKDNKERESNADRPKEQPISKEEEKLRENIQFFQSKPQNEEPVRRRVQSQSSQDDDISHKTPKKDEVLISEDEDVIQFDKKLLKIIMPQSIEKVRLISKVEAKLTSCLERKKPQIPMKKLVKTEMLLDIIGKRPRKIISGFHGKEKMDTEAQSLRKDHRKSSERSDSSKKRVKKNEDSKDDYKYLKALPLKVPKIQKEIVHKAQEKKEFKFSSQESSNFFEGFNDFGESFTHFSFNENKNPFSEEGENSNKQRNVFSSQNYSDPHKYVENPQKYRNRQCNYDQNFFTNSQNLSFDIPKPSKSTPNIQKIIIPHLKVPHQRRERRVEYNQLPIVEQQGSKFFSPQKRSNQISFHQNQPRYRQHGFWSESDSAEEEYSNPFL